MLADLPLDGPIGAIGGVTLLGAVVTILTALLNALLKTSTKADSINERIVKAKDAELVRARKDHAEALEHLRADHAREVDALNARLANVQQERDLWYRRATGQQEHP